MKSLAVCLLSLLVSASTASAEAPIVSGQVRLVDGSPVAEAQVLLFDVADLRRGALVQATTDAEGQFALPLAGFDRLSPQLGGRGLPQGFALGQNYPNPFNPSTVIPYQLQTAAHVRLEVFNLLGQRVATLVDGAQVAGAHRAVWTATDGSGQAVSAGVYLYRLTVASTGSADGMATGRMVLVDGGAGIVGNNDRYSLQMPRGGGRVGGVSMDVENTAYGLVVSGSGMVPYVDGDFRVGSGPVVIEIEAAPAGRAKAAQGDVVISVVLAYVLGDVDNNGEVNILDALLVAMYSADASTVMPNGGDIRLGDVNGDGTVDLTDAWLIGLYALDPSAAGLPAGLGEAVRDPLADAVGGFDAPTKLTDNGFWDGDPSWSPDGRRIAFASDRGGKNDVYIMWANGDDSFNVTNRSSSNDWGPSWSPDGTRLAFTSDIRSGALIPRQDVYIIDINGDNLTLLTQGGHSPSWSPDGTQIGFSFSEGYVISADGRSDRVLVARLSATSNSSWSPDGSKIVFEASELYVVAADGSGDPVQLTNAANASKHPSWSPDGMKIVFSSNRLDVDNYDLFVMNADGSGSVRASDLAFG